MTTIHLRPYKGELKELRNLLTKPIKTSEDWERIDKLKEEIRLIQKDRDKILRQVHGYHERNKQEEEYLNRLLEGIVPYSAEEYQKLGLKKKTPEELAELRKRMAITRERYKRKDIISKIEEVRDLNISRLKGKKFSEKKKIDLQIERYFELIYDQLKKSSPIYYNNNKDQPQPIDIKFKEDMLQMINSVWVKSLVLKFYRKYRNLKKFQ